MNNNGNNNNNNNNKIKIADQQKINPRIKAITKLLYFRTSKSVSYQKKSCRFKLYIECIVVEDQLLSYCIPFDHSSPRLLACYQSCSRAFLLSISALDSIVGHGYNDGMMMMMCPMIRCWR